MPLARSFLALVWDCSHWADTIGWQLQRSDFISRAVKRGACKYCSGEVRNSPSFSFTSSCYHRYKPIALRVRRCWNPHQFSNLLYSGSLTIERRVLHERIDRESGSEHISHSMLRGKLANV